MTTPTGRDDPAELWDAVADSWEAKVGDHGDWMRRDLLVPTVLGVLKTARPSPMRVLDAGCGNGFLTRIFCDQGFDCVGCDISPANVAYAQARVGPERAFVADITDLHVAHAGTFAAVVANFVLDSVPALSPALRSLHGVIATDGILVATIPHPWFYYGFLGRADQYGVPVEVATRLYGVSAPVVEYLRPLSDYVDGLRSCGFALVRLLEPRNTARVQDYFDKRKAGNPPVALCTFVARKSGS